MLFIYILIFILGLCVGSFTNVLIWRVPQGKTLLGRSMCPHCHRQIAWFDNIPLLSFLLLKRKCRDCHFPISWQYPLGELSVAILFLATYFLITPPFVFLIWLLIPLLTAIFVIDLRMQIIPDALTFSALVLTFFYFLLVSPISIFPRLFAAFAAALLLLILHLITKGKGMGLGDVKFALLGGLITGTAYFLHWLFLSFLTGAVIGLILILTKKSKLKSKIAFGPFLVLGLLLTLYWFK